MVELQLVMYILEIVLLKSIGVMDKRQVVIHLQCMGRYAQKSRNRHILYRSL